MYKLKIRLVNGTAPLDQIVFVGERFKEIQVDRLDDFEKIREKMKKSISIFMVSSSIDPEDINRAKQHKLVKDYVVKPVSKETFAKLVGMAA